MGELCDLQDCFPSTRRKGVREIRRLVGFPERWQRVCESLYGNSTDLLDEEGKVLQGAGPRMYLKVKGKVYWGGRQGDGPAQG